MDVTVQELAGALVRAGWFFPSQLDQAVIAAEDILAMIAEGRSR